MKKLLLIILTFALACCLLFGGCTNSYSKREIYKFKELTIEEGDTEFTFEVGEKFEGQRLTADTFILILDKETAILRVYSYEQNDNEAEEEINAYVFSWIEGINNELYFFSQDNNTIEYIAKKNGNTLTLKGFYGINILFAK